MKNILYLFLSTLLVLTAGCKDDNAGGGDSPKFTFDKPSDQWLPGYDYEIKGTASDPVGLKSVQVVSDELGLDELVRFGSGKVTDFKLTYPVFIAEDLDPESVLEIAVVVTNRNGVSATERMSLRLDADPVVPVFESRPDELMQFVATPGGPGIDCKLSFIISDNRALGSLRIVCPELDIDETESLEERYEAVTKTYVLPESEASYTFSYTLTDAAGNIATASSIVKVGQPDFPKMYLLDIFDMNEIQKYKFGVPTIMDKTASMQYSLIYFSSAVNTKIACIPQSAGALVPNCFGDDGTESGILVNDKDARITIPGIGYYRVSLDLKAMTYTVQRFEVNSSSPDYVQPRLVWFNGINFLTIDGKAIPNWGMGEEHMPYVDEANSPYLFTFQFISKDASPTRMSLNTRNVGDELPGNTHPWAEKWVPDPNTSGADVIFGRQGIEVANAPYDAPRNEKMQLWFDYLTRRGRLKILDK